MSVVTRRLTSSLVNSWGSMNFTGTLLQRVTNTNFCLKPLVMFRTSSRSLSSGITDGNKFNQPTTTSTTKLSYNGNSLGNITKSLQMLRSMTSSVSKKRVPKRKAVIRSKVIDELGIKSYDHLHDDVTFPVVAYATCEELDLEDLKKGLVEEGLYVPTNWSEELSLEDVVHVTAVFKTGMETREIFFFREGAIVFWNVHDCERSQVLKFANKFQQQSYLDVDVAQESEFMLYANVSDGTRLSNKGRILLHGVHQQNPLAPTLEKYTFSNAMALSVKLGIWESTLNKFVHSIEHVTEELKLGHPIRMSRNQVLQKTGELFALRHEINLNSDLLDTPDFYWDRDNLENLYHKTINYLSINRRTNVMNEKLNQCVELLELILSDLNDKHHVRLEWLIILLIMIEVGFEIFHVLDRYQII